MKLRPNPTALVRTCDDHTTHGLLEKSNWRGKWETVAAPGVWQVEPSITISRLTPVALHEAKSMQRAIKALCENAQGDKVLEMLVEHGVVDALYDLPCVPVRSAGDIGWFIETGYIRLERVDLETSDASGLIFQGLGHKDFLPRDTRRDALTAMDKIRKAKALAAMEKMQNAKAEEGNAVVDEKIATSHVDGIDWSSLLTEYQYDQSPNRVKVKPVVTTIYGAGHAGKGGLLHVLFNTPGVPVEVFDTKIVRYLINHKWKEFGYDNFVRDLVAFSVMVSKALAFIVMPLPSFLH